MLHADGDEIGLTENYVADYLVVDHHSGALERRIQKSFIGATEEKLFSLETGEQLSACLKRAPQGPPGTKTRACPNAES